MDAFFGSWKLVKTENFDEFLTACGIEEEMRKAIKVVRPVHTFSHDGDGLVFKSEAVLGKRENKFQFGEEFEEETVPGEFCKTIITLEGEKLIKVRKDPDNDVLIIREIQDGKLITTYTCNDITAVLTYEKV